MKKMFKRFKEMLKEQVGFTLVELLAVIVILGIIAGIAVPAIGGVIDSSKDDAHVSTGIQLIEAARMGVAADQYSTGDVTIATLVTDGYLESVPTDPEGVSYDDTASKVTIAANASGAGVTYSVVLEADTTATGYYNDTGNEINGLDLAGLQSLRESN